MKSVFLHLGFHKTASTSIQNTCELNFGNGRRDDYFYPVFSIGETALVNHSFPILILFSSSRNDYLKRIDRNANLSDTVQELSRQLDEVFVSGRDRVIISGEAITHLSLSELQAFSDRLLSHGYSVRVLTLIRPPFSFLCSSIQTRVVAGQAIGNYSYNYGLVERIKKIEKVFSSVEFISFREACRHQAGPTGYFLERIGVDTMSEISFWEGNRGWDSDVVRALSFLNKYSALDIHRRRAIAKSISFGSDKKFVLKPSETFRFVNELRADNDFLKMRFGPSFCDDDFLAK